ncbi:unnamed protein product [Linum trigynum]|uniref:Cell cycle checkpoint protein RAD17 n=1 Tax=Linum trigynum TaxID=586398 RepID=A0AAV2D009_9ROSI
MIISSDDDEDSPRSSSRRTRSHKKIKPKQQLLTLTNPREPKTTKKKPNISNSSQPRLSRESSFVDEIRLSFEEFDQCLSRSKVSSGSGSTNAGELWVDKYKPQGLEELAVHKKKVEEVKRWFEEKLNASKGSSESNVLIITGQAGVGKSATIRVMASQFGVTLYEWNTPIPTTWREHVHNSDTGIRYTSKLDEFVNFVEKIRKYGLLPSSISIAPKELFVLLIDDLPLVNGRTALEKLQNCLLILTRSAQLPTVVVVTDGGKEDSADQASRCLEELQNSVQSAGASKVAFNPITHNSMKKVLTRICIQEQYNVSADQINLIAKASGGDIRHAITSLQLFCVKPDPKENVSLLSSSLSCSSVNAEEIDDLVNGVSSLFGKDETLSLFHALGKFLYNKRETEVSLTLDQDAFLVQEKFYRFPLQMEAPEKVLSQSHGQARQIADFLHENNLDFISDQAMEDAWEVATYLSDADLLLSSFRALLARHNEAEHNVLQSAAASVACRGVLFGNAHPSPRRWHSIRKPKLWQVERSMLDNKKQIGTQRFVAYGGRSSMDLTGLAIEYTSMLRLQGNRASGHGLNQSADITDFEEASEMSDDGIEDFSD